MPHELPKSLHAKFSVVQYYTVEGRCLGHILASSFSSSITIIMKLAILAFLASVLVALSIGPSLAQTPIRDLQRNAAILITGEIRSVVGNEFILDDGTGQIIVDAGPVWYHQLTFRQGERVTVFGEYDDYDFDAFTITRSNDEVIYIRDVEGPPPWAGGRNRRVRF